MTNNNSKKTIIIVNQGDPSSISNAKYEDLAEMLKMYLENRVTFAKKDLNILAFKKAEQASEYLRSNDAKAIIYISSYQFENAKKNRLDHPGLTIIIFTGLRPEKAEGINIFEKNEKDSLESMATLVID